MRSAAYRPQASAMITSGNVGVSTLPSAPGSSGSTVESNGAASEHRADDPPGERAFISDSSALEPADGFHILGNRPPRGEVATITERKRSRTTSAAADEQQAAGERDDREIDRDLWHPHEQHGEDEQVRRPGRAVAADPHGVSTGTSSFRQAPRAPGSNTAAAMTPRRPTTSPHNAKVAEERSPRSCRPPRRRLVSKPEHHGAADAVAATTRPRSARARAPPVAAPRRSVGARKAARMSANRPRRPARPGRSAASRWAVGADSTSRDSRRPAAEVEELWDRRARAAWKSASRALWDGGPEVRGGPRQREVHRPAAEERAVHRLDTVVELRGEGPAAHGVRDGCLDRRAQLRERRISFDRAVRDPRAHLGLDLVLRERGRRAVGERLLVEHGGAAVERERADHEQEHPTHEQCSAHP